tara:strand:- start:159 stop:368 length:210 start_codon:yes stop_codon:yes gene_type:complete
MDWSIVLKIREDSMEQGIWSDFALEGLKKMQEQEKSIKRIEKRVKKGKKLLKNNSLHNVIAIMRNNKNV